MSIDIINDDIYEGKKEFFIAIDELPIGLVRGNPYETTIEISDDECKWMYFMYIHKLGHNYS